MTVNGVQALVEAAVDAVPNELGGYGMRRVNDQAAVQVGHGVRSPYYRSQCLSVSKSVKTFPYYGKV